MSKFQFFYDLTGKIISKNHTSSVLVHLISTSSSHPKLLQGINFNALLIVKAAIIQRKPP